MLDSPVVKGYGMADGPMILGEAPGAQEVAKGVPFVGEAGKILRATLQAVGADPEECYITNSVICRPPGNATPTPDHIECCSLRLGKEISLIQPTKILAVGSVALTAVLHAPKSLPITKWRGRGFWSPWGTRDIYTVATYHPAAVLRDAELFRDFASDIEKWWTHDHPMLEPILTEYVPESPEEAIKLLNALQRAAGAPFISVDLETTGKDAYYDDTMTYGYGTLFDFDKEPDGKTADGMTVIIPSVLTKDPALRTRMQSLVTNESFDGWVSFQNMKFDLKFIYYLLDAFARPEKPLDTMLLSYVLDERPASGRFQVHGLKAQARVRYDAAEYEINFDKFFAQSQEEQDAQKPELYHYQSLDLYYTARLAYDLTKEVEKEGLQPVVDKLLLPGTLAFTEIEMRGVRLDIPYLKGLQKKFEKETQDKLKELQAIAEEHGFPDFNPLSPMQIVKLLYNTWHLPKPRKNTTDRKELHDMVPKIKDPVKQEFVRKLIEFRLDIKTLGTYVEGLLDRAHDDERIRSNFALVGTVTGRLSSSNPNLQNIPGRHGSTIRNAFIASEGYTFIEADYSQLEVRVAAALCGEEVWVEAFKSGRDLHRMVAAAMLNKAESDVTEFERRIAKTVDFGILYGRGAKSLTEGQELKHLPEGQKWWTFEEAVKFQQQFLEQFPKLAAWMEKVKSDAVKNHYVQAPSGRRRRFPLINRNLHEVRRQAGNMPIQSSASDICLTALIRLHDELPEGAYVLFSVHDAIYLECEERLEKKVLKQVRETMLDVVPDVLGFVPDVPFDVKIKTGKRWAEEPEN